MTEMFGEAWSPMSVPDLAPDDDDEHIALLNLQRCDEWGPRNDGNVPAGPALAYVDNPGHCHACSGFAWTSWA